MYESLGTTSIVRPPSRLRWLTFLGLGLCLAGLLTALVMVSAQTLLPPAIADFTPTAEDGYRPDGTVVTVDDEALPMISRLQPSLHDALRQAAADAASDGVSFQVTSGWRSDRYQQRLLDDAIQQYGSEQVAREFVATPDTSKHVTGDAVDIGPLDAQVWLSANGARYGICQTYANERWHFEIATEPGGVCPVMKTDAAG